MSRDLLWAVMNKNSAYRRCFRNVKQPLSMEPLNMQKRHSMRYSGLVNPKMVSLEADKSGKGITLLYKTKNQQKPNKAVVRVPLKKDGRKTIKSVAGFCKNYRPALSKLAQRRASQLVRSQRPISAKRARKIKKHSQA